VPAIAAKVGMIVGMALYSFFTFVNIQDVPVFLANSERSLHWLHGYFISFAGSIIVMMIIGYFYPKSEAEILKSDEREPAPVDMIPWKSAKKVSVAIIVITVVMYLALTGIAN
jgi:SSS family solute:Na+ symporter